MVYTKAFFDLQLEFARKVTVLSRLPLESVLLRYTNFYIRFGLGREFDAAHPTWRAYLTGIQDAQDQPDWTYRFYLMHSETLAGPPVEATFGCFSYALSHEGRIRLHFQNADTKGHSSLGVACVEQRRADLTALFAHVRRTLPEQVLVTGVSWLYNLNAYRRLFPASYIATARVINDRFQAMPLWGQFLDRYGGLKQSMVRPFLARLDQQTSLEGLHNCFPFQVIAVEAPASVFFDFYDL
jgi:hypothetical protein